jgi:hypothetical protein
VTRNRSTTATARKEVQCRATGSTKTPSCSSHRCDLWTGEVWQSNQYGVKVWRSRGIAPLLRSCGFALDENCQAFPHAESNLAWDLASGPSLAAASTGISTSRAHAQTGRSLLWKPRQQSPQGSRLRFCKSTCTGKRMDVSWARPLHPDIETGVLRCRRSDDLRRSLDRFWLLNMMFLGPLMMSSGQGKAE